MATVVPFSAFASRRKHAQFNRAVAAIKPAAKAVRQTRQAVQAQAVRMAARAAI